MTIENANYLAKLDLLRQECKEASVRFQKEYGDELEAFRKQIDGGIKEILTGLSQNVSEVSGGNDVCKQLVQQAVDYIDWLQWSLWDLPYIAVVLQPPAERFRQAVAACGLVYLSIRIFDDVIDRHFWYKGRHLSLLSVASDTFPSSQGAEGLTILAGLLLCFEGLSKIEALADEESKLALRTVLSSVRNAVIGAIMEQSEPQVWDEAYYARLVQLKNVDYWRCTYAALDPKGDSSLYPFLVRYYTLAQYLNDVQDFPEDKERAQPNLLSLYISEHDQSIMPVSANGNRVSLVPADAESLIASVFFELAEMSEKLTHAEHLVAQLKLGESLENAYRYGLFSGSISEESPPAHESSPPHLELHWYSTCQEVIEKAGVEALVKVNCAVCGSEEHSFLFRKHGFAFHRCQICSHIYVSPRITSALQIQIGKELDKVDVEDGYMKVQRVYAANICQMLRTRAPGNRLLDIGFGHGYLMELAQAYGFEVYGIDSSRTMVDRLWPRLGNRVAQGVMGRDEIPWSSFDVVVMTHVLEHLPDPKTSLQQVYKLMNPGAILYATVPDTGSLPFKIFGKKWDVINPIVHFQFFNEKSFSQVIETAGFIDLKRIEPATIPAEVASRWMRLMQQLSGSDASDVTILAQVLAET